MRRLTAFLYYLEAQHYRPLKIRPDVLSQRLMKYNCTWKVSNDRGPLKCMVRFLELVVRLRNAALKLAKMCTMPRWGHISAELLPRRPRENKKEEMTKQLCAIKLEHGTDWINCEYSTIWGSF